jgi:hypothetical protein
MRLREASLRMTLSLFIKNRKDFDVSILPGSAEGRSNSRVLRFAAEGQQEI